jgi:hypothetical protein
MKLSQATIEALKNCASINPGIIINEGNELRSISPASSVMAKIKVPEEFDRQFGIGDLSQFLGVLALFNEPEIEFKDQYLIVGTGSERVVYLYGDMDSIKTPKKVPNFTSDISFDLSKASLDKILKAASVLGVSEMSIVGEDGKLFARTFDSKIKNGSNYSVEVGETDLEFSAVFKIEYLKFLPDDYTVEIMKKGLSKFTSQKAEYFVALEAGASEF